MVGVRAKVGLAKAKARVRAKVGLAKAKARVRLAPLQSPTWRSCPAAAHLTLSPSSWRGCSLLAHVDEALAVVQLDATEVARRLIAWLTGGSSSVRWPSRSTSASLNFAAASVGSLRAQLLAASVTGLDGVGNVTSLLHPVDEQPYALLTAGGIGLCAAGSESDEEQREGQVETEEQALTGGGRYGAAQWRRELSELSELRGDGAEGDGCRATPLRLSVTANVTFDSADGSNGESSEGHGADAADASTASSSTAAAISAALSEWMGIPPWGAAGGESHDAHINDHFSVHVELRGAAVAALTELRVDGARWRRLTVRPSKVCSFSARKMHETPERSVICPVLKRGGALDVRGRSEKNRVPQYQTYQRIWARVPA